jgi:hypothetical protein
MQRRLWGPRQAHPARTVSVFAGRAQPLGAPPTTTRRAGARVFYGRCFRRTRRSSQEPRRRRCDCDHASPILVFFVILVLFVFLVLFVLVFILKLFVERLAGAVVRPFAAAGADAVQDGSAARSARDTSARVTHVSTPSKNKLLASSHPIGRILQNPPFMAPTWYVRPCEKQHPLCKKFRKIFTRLEGLRNAVQVEGVKHAAICMGNP